MIDCKLAFTALNPLGPYIILTICTPLPAYVGVESSLGFSETSNLGAVAPAVSPCAGLGLAFATPNPIGRTKANKTAVLSNNFLLKSSFRAIRSVMILTILFLRSDPVTPDTQASGDSTQNSHTF